MKTGNIIRNMHFIGNGWDFNLQIRAASDKEFEEAKRYIRDYVVGHKADAARQEFLKVIKDRTGDVH